MTARRMLSIVSMIAALLALSDIAAMAQERQADSLYVTGQSDSGFVGGAAGEVEWVKAISDPSSLLFGGASSSRGDAWWSYGRVGGFTKRRGITLMGTADAGWGAYRNVRFPYLRYAVSVAAPVGHQIYLESEAQTAYAVRTATRVIKGGVAYAGFRHTEIRGAFHHSSMETVRWRYVSARADVTLGRFGGAGGATQGSKSPSPDASVLELLPATSQEWFGSFWVDAQGARTTCAFEAMRLPGGRARRMTVTLRLPIGSRVRAKGETPE